MAANQDAEAIIEIKKFKIPFDRTTDGRILPNAFGRRDTLAGGRRIQTVGAVAINCSNDVGYDPDTTAIRARDAAMALVPRGEEMIEWSRTCRLVVIVAMEETCPPE